MLKRNADALGNGLDPLSMPVKHRKQTGPERAQQVADIPLENIQDKQVHEKIIKIRQTLPSATVVACRNAIVAKKGDLDDALALLMSDRASREVVDITKSDDEGRKNGYQARPPAPTAKRGQGGESNHSRQVVIDSGLASSAEAIIACDGDAAKAKEAARARSKSTFDTRSGGHQAIHRSSQIPGPLR